MLKRIYLRKYPSDLNLKAMNLLFMWGGTRSESADQFTVLWAILLAILLDLVPVKRNEPPKKNFDRSLRLARAVIYDLDWQGGQHKKKDNTKTSIIFFYLHLLLS